MGKKERGKGKKHRPGQVKLAEKRSFPKFKILPEALSPDPPKKVSFSFELLQEKHQKFSYNRCNEKYFLNLLVRLRKLSCFDSQTFETLLNDNYWRVHSISWKTTSERKGFSHLSEEYQGCVPYQFNTGYRKGRAHGFLVEDVFYVVWLDPNHKLSSKPHT